MLFSLFLLIADYKLPAEAFVQASWPQEASDRVPYQVVASCRVGAYKAAGLACASYEGPGS